LSYTAGIVVVVVIIVGIVVAGLWAFGRRSSGKAVGQPAGWERVEKSAVEKSPFILSGEAVNHRDGRPYKLHMRFEGGRQVWYAEMLDADEWFKTDIGEKQD
jgi:hypothetical protein